MFKLFRALALAATLAIGVVGKSVCENLDGASAIFADMHDGDQKAVSIAGSALTIKPHGNKETWTVEATLDLTFCNASVNFDVPGKPSPPPRALTATLWTLTREDPGAGKYALEFTDPSGTLAPATMPLNAWVQIA